MSFEPMSFHNPMAQLLATKGGQLSEELGLLRGQLASTGDMRNVDAEVHDRIAQRFAEVLVLKTEVAELTATAASTDWDEEIAILVNRLADDIMPRWKEIDNVYQVFESVWQRGQDGTDDNNALLVRSEKAYVLDTGVLEEKITTAIKAAPRPQQAIVLAVETWLKELQGGPDSPEHMMAMAEFLPNVAAVIKEAKLFNPRAIDQYFTPTVTSKIGDWFEENPQLVSPALLTALPAELRRDIEQRLLGRFAGIEEMLMQIGDSGKVAEELGEQLSEALGFAEKTGGEIADRLQGQISNGLTACVDKVAVGLRSPLSASSAEYLMQMDQALNMLAESLPGDKLQADFAAQAKEKLAAVFENLTVQDLRLLEGQEALPQGMRAGFGMHAEQLELLERVSKGVVVDADILGEFLQNMETYLGAYTKPNSLITEAYSDVLQKASANCSSLCLKGFQGTFSILEFNNALSKLVRTRKLAEGVIELTAQLGESVASLGAYIGTLSRVSSELEGVDAAYKTPINPVVDLMQGLVGDLVTSFFTKQSGFLNIEENAEELRRLKQLLADVPMALGADPVELTIAPPVANPSETEWDEHRRLLQEHDLL